MKVVLYILGAAALAILAVVVLVALLLSTTGFCDLVATLHAALVGGEAVWEAIKDFAGRVTESMIGELPDNVQAAARAAVETAERIASLALEILVEPLLGPFKTAVEQLNNTCQNIP